MSYRIETSASSDLLKALMNGNITQVEHILEQTNSVTGIPIADINHLRPPKSTEDQTALRVALYSTPFFEVSPKTRNHLATCILNVVDAQGNPVIQLNGRDSLGDTILDQVEKTVEIDKLYESDGRALISRILHLRNADGSRAFQPDNELLIRARDWAIQKGNDFLVQEIDDLRHADGAHVINAHPSRQAATRTHQVSKVKSNRINIVPVTLPAQPERIQPVATQASQASQVDNTHLHIVPAASSLRLDPTDSKIEDRIAKAQNWQPLSNAVSELQIFHNNSQNVHTATVEESALKSLKSLCKKYFSMEEFSAGWPSVYVDIFNATYKEIEKHISVSTRIDKEKIKLGLEFILTSSYRHGATYLSLKQILCLLWMAATDLGAPCPSNPHLDRVTLTQLRKEAILDRIFDAEVVYKRGRNCTGGYINNLVASLSQAHECVNVLLVQSGLLEAATDSLNFWILQKIEKLPFDTQKSILSSWDDIENDSDNAARKFHSCPLYIEEMFSKLERNFSLSEALKMQIRSAWYSLPRPSLHQELSSLLDRIFGMYAPRGQRTLFLFDQAFQSFAKKAIQNSVSFQAAYELLKEEYETYLESRKLLVFLGDFFEDSSKNSSLKEIEMTLKKLDQNQTISEAREQIYVGLKNAKIEAKKILLDQARTAPLKNALMLFVPIIGWAVLFYRFLTKPTALFPLPSAQKMLFLWSS